MKKKLSYVVTAILGAGLLATGTLSYRQMREERKKKQALAQVRSFFTDFGTIATVFIDEQASSSRCLTGGVVMEEGIVYLFENDGGLIRYEEESA